MEEEAAKTPDKAKEDQKLESKIDSLILSFQEDEAAEEEAAEPPPVTPKKTNDSFVFKTPNKTPFKTPCKTPRRHVPPSPLAALLSPHSSLAVPRTPGRPSTPSYLPSSLTTPSKVLTVPLYLPSANLLSPSPCICSRVLTRSSG